MTTVKIGVTGAPTAAATGAKAVDVALQERSVNPSVLTVGGGVVTFNVKNTGPQYKHEFVVLKTDLAATALPKKADGTVDEEGAGITSPGEIADLAIGEQKSTPIDLTPDRTSSSAISSTRKVASLSCTSRTVWLELSRCADLVGER